MTSLLFKSMNRSHSAVLLNASDCLNMTHLLTREPASITRRHR